MTALTVWTTSLLVGFGAAQKAPDRKKSSPVGIGLFRSSPVFCLPIDSCRSLFCWSANMMRANAVLSALAHSNNLWRKRTNP